MSFKVPNPLADFMMNRDAYHKIVPTHGTQYDVDDNSPKLVLIVGQEIIDGTYKYNGATSSTDSET